MTPSFDRPLLTIAVTAFNQEPYIREAVEAAFLQRYEPLEIILSDDCSADQTSEIMREMAAAYRGPHKVVLNRNLKNLGICPHVNRVMELAGGELIITAAGDDRALPNRAEKALEVWNRTQRNADGMAFGFFSDVMDGSVWRPLGTSMLTAKEIIERGNSGIRGASAVWTRRLFRQWGPLPDDAGAEDQVLAFRAALGGGLVSDPSPVVVYRSNPDRRGLGGHDRFAVRLWKLRRIRGFYNICLNDLRTLKTMNGRWPEETQLLEKDLRRRQDAIEREIAYLEQGTPIAGLTYLLAVLAGVTWTRLRWGKRPIGALAILRHLVLKRRRLAELATSDHNAPNDLVRPNGNRLK